VLGRGIEAGRPETAGFYWQAEDKRHFLNNNSKQIDNMKKPLTSFHGEQKIKDGHIARLQMHSDADEIIQGNYWQNGKGCDTGCSFHSSDHSQWAKQLGIPVIIGYLRDRIFEGLPNAEAKLFPLACSNATPVGVDLEPVWRKFMIWLLVDERDGVIKYARNENSRQAIKNIADTFERSLAAEIPWSEWNELRNAVRPPAAAAAYAAAYAAAAADAAAAAAAAVDDAAAYAAAYAAAAYAHAAAYAADAAASRFARQKAFIRMSEKLIELLKAA
jgi:hypothetical protein